MKIVVDSMNYEHLQLMMRNVKKYSSIVLRTTIGEIDYNTYGVRGYCAVDVTFEIYENRITEFGELYLRL